MLPDALRISPRIIALPIVHGSGDCALVVRRMLLEERFDCVAVPLPPSFQSPVEEAIHLLPSPSIVVQRAQPRWLTENNADEDESDSEPEVSYVPIDPCQAVIMALRVAMSERIPRAFIDLETERFRPTTQQLPDPYALKTVAPERFAAAILPAIPPLPEGQPTDRARHMAGRLRDLERKHKSILLVCSVLDWPWIREAYTEQLPCDVLDDDVQEPENFAVDPHTLVFLFSEWPFITGLYERARAELDADENLSIDGVKELLVAARAAYRRELKGRARKITPQLLRQCLKYARNLSLLEKRLTPDMYTIVMAAKQCAGDQFALHVAEKLRSYLEDDQGLPSPVYLPPLPWDSVTMGIGRGRLPDGELVEMISRLPVPPSEWRDCQLTRRPDKKELDRWEKSWNPYSQCSWPPEDELIENFRNHVFERARAIMGQDLARTEKFTTSVMDGIDIRDTLRHWYDGDIYVKIMPPTRGFLDCAVMLFDSPADPRMYPWRTTWFAEHEEESTLAFFASDYTAELVGPGIAAATYGGALFLYPPVPIRDVWHDEALDFTSTLEERLIAAACKHARSPHVVLLSALPPGAGWRRLAKQYKKKLVHVPLAQFSDSTIQQLRTVHVLNGRQVRSYAAEFIRKA
ncbi:MAG TPA: hypothetical protein VL096_18870 [Pirellulaceae bacterium]|nr:hypothetical protein [Pirellulaceae bacterium]